MTKFVNYYRVSTKGQGESGLGLESQKAILAHFLEGREVVQEFTEVASAKNVTGRPLLQEAVRLCLEEGYTLAVAKIDRLSRKTEDALAIHAQLDGKLFSGDIPQENGKMDKFILTIFMAIADRERELIGIRTKAALQAKAARGEYVGRKDIYTPEGQAKAAAANKANAVSDYSLIAGYVSTLRENGSSFASIADTLNAEGHVTRTGKEFAPMTVKRIYDRSLKGKGE